MPTIKIHGNYTPAQRRTIRLALERRLVSDKAQAREEGVSPRSIGDRWDGIAHRLHLPFGQRERAQVIAELVVRKHIEVAVLALAILTSIGTYGTQPQRPRPPSGARTVATLARPASTRKPGQDGGMAGLNTWGIAA